MTDVFINQHSLDAFHQYLYEDEREPATISKYMHDIIHFADFIKEGPITKQSVIQYKNSLEQTYCIRSANSMLSAVNKYMHFINKDDFCVRKFKIQENTFCKSEDLLTKQEYERLIKTIEEHKDTLMSLVIQSMASTGARVSELRFFTVESLRNQEVIISNKGKTRKILLPKKLCKQVLSYAKSQGITQKAIFLTKQQKPLRRDFIWRKMQSYGTLAGIDKRKLHPHNLRRLFSRVFYDLTKDISKLADILGHSSVNTTRHYIKGTGEEHRKQLEIMNMMITEGKEDTQETADTSTTAQDTCCHHLPRQSSQRKSQKIYQRKKKRKKAKKKHNSHYVAK